MLARVGALNFLSRMKRRDALWNVERARRSAGPLFEMLQDERIRFAASADGSEGAAACRFPGTGLTIGRHPMAFYREEMDRLGSVRRSKS